MAGRVAEYRADLRVLRDWEPYLKKHSGLPGPRANLELVQAVGDEADPDRLWRLSASSDEFLALCGTAGLGRIASSEPETVMTWLRELAADPRWRVREGVAIALQRVGRESMPRLLAEMRVWASDGPFVQRAAVAGLCEPALLKKPEQAGEVLGILDQVTRSLAATSDRRHEGFRVLRKALGYGWSVAAAAAPAKARPLMERWLRSTDKDVAWVIKSNLRKARVAGLARELAADRNEAPARSKPATKPKAKAEPRPKPSSKPEPKPRVARRAPAKR